MLTLALGWMMAAPMMFGLLMLWAFSKRKK